MKLILAIFALALVLPSVLPQGYDCDTGYVPGPNRRDCFPEPGANEESCRARNCTWCLRTAYGGQETRGIPSCFFNQPPSNGGYRMVGEPIVLPDGGGYRVNLERERGSDQDAPKWDGESEVLTLEAHFQSNSRLRIKITEPDTNKWEVPLAINPPSDGNTNPLYDIEFSNEAESGLFAFRVIRKSTGAVVMDAGGSNGRFIIADQYLTLSWRPPTDRLYGLGENEQRSFKHDFSRNLTWGLFAFGHNTDYQTNLYGVHPFYTVLEADGKAHSVVIVNSNAQEFTLSDSNGPHINYATTGGLLDIYIFLGPTPENTVQQYTEAVGRQQLPPYWSLGFHLCRYGYDTLDSMKEAVDRTIQYNIPYDVQYGDIDIMDRRLDFTYDNVNFAGLPEYIKELKTKGIKFITILDPVISIGEPTGSYRPYDYGVEVGNDIWVKRADGTNAVGRMWPPDDVHFPDYSNPKTREWWVTLMAEFHDLLEYDGIWIDMNEPANFVTGDVNSCPDSKWNNPPYTPRIKSRLTEGTLCMDNTDTAGRHYDSHSLYGWFQSETTLAGVRAGTGKRGLVLSRSTYLGSGRWAAHWLGDNYSTWDNMFYSIVGMLQFNLFGIPFVGADICGHNYDVPAEMCERWMELGAFYPFSRNHNGNGNAPQDPGVFGPEVAESSRKALMTRYTLLPYLYTLFYEHYVNGGTVARALWHEFPTDSIAAGIDRQFMWGSGLLISPVLEEGVVELNAYLPDARLYDYNGGAESNVRGGFATLSAPRDVIPLHIVGGNILPTQDPAVTTELARNNALGLIVALDDSGSALGRLYYDDGDSVDPVENESYFSAVYTATNGVLTSAIVRDGYSGMAEKVLDTVRLLGAGTVTSITVNGAVHEDFVSSPSGEVVITNLGIAANSVFTITY